MSTEIEVKKLASNVVDTLAGIEESFRLAKLELLRKEAELFRPLYAKREKITSAIPRFWSTVLSIEDELEPYIKEGEADLLKSCSKFSIERSSQDPRNFTMSIHFTENAYLEATSCSLVKQFKFDGGRLTSDVVTINWKQAKDLVKIAASESRLSFFSLFSFVGMPEDEVEGAMDVDDEEEENEQLVLEDMAMLLADEVYPHALSYFTDALAPPETPAESPHLKAMQNGNEKAHSGTETPYLALESMTTSFLDQQEVKGNTTHLGDPKVDVVGGKNHHLGKNSKAIEQYAESKSLQFSDRLKRHREESIEAFNELKMITINEAQFLHFLISSLKVEKVLEIGCFTGYSALVFAHAGAKEIITCEIDPELASFAKLGIHEAGFADTIRVVVGDAHEKIKDRQTVQGPFDLIFIDAEKEGYQDYLLTILDRNLLRKNGGLIIADNTLRRGAVASMEFPERHRVLESPLEKKRNDEFESGVQAIRQFNDFVHSRADLETVLVPCWDGLSLIRYK